MTKTYLQLIDTKTKGQRYDVTPLFADPEAFSSLVSDLVRHFENIEFDAVAGIDALGFILGTGIALRTKKGFIPIRKGGKLPVETHNVEFVDYTGQEKQLELRTDALKPGTKVLLVDEWIETGAQVKAAIELIKKLECRVVGVATIRIDYNETTREIFENYKCYSVW